MMITQRLATKSRGDIIDITEKVAAFVRDSGVQDGLCVVFVPHTTAAVSINENADPDVKHDVLQKLSELIPQREAYYEHSEGNSDSHVKTILTGPSITLIVEHGKLILGTWQGIYFCEYDGPRTRTYHVKILGSAIV